MDLRSQHDPTSPRSPNLHSSSQTTRPADPLSFDFLTEPFVDPHKNSSSETNFFLTSSSAPATHHTPPSSQPPASHTNTTNTLPRPHILAHHHTPTVPLPTSTVSSHHPQVKTSPHHSPSPRQPHSSSPPNTTHLPSSTVHHSERLPTQLSPPSQCHSPLQVHASRDCSDPFADPVALYASLHTPNAPQLTTRQRRRLRILLRARRRRRRTRTDHTRLHALMTPSGSPVMSSSSSPSATMSANAASLKDKKAARVIRNREVALRARQMAKLKMKNLESENCSLKSRATSLESENLTLRSYVHRLTGGRGLPGLQGDLPPQWPHDVPAVDGAGVVGVVPQ